VAVDLATPLPYLLFLHVFGAILAFGPTYAFSIMGSMAGREPQHANFSTRQVATISRGIVYPLAIIQGITGVLLIVAADLKAEKQPWLMAGIILYLIALIYSLTIQRSAVHRFIALTSTPPPAGGQAGAPAAGAPAGPPPEVMATVARIRRGGMITGLLIVVIVFLMVTKPGLTG
jgi:uncharacterized membrane protein